MAVSNVCPSCDMATENCQHLFRFCPLASGAWRTSQLSINSTTAPYISFKDWLIAWIFYFHRQDGFNGDRLPLFLATLWAIWRCRDDEIFNNITPDLELIRSLVQQFLQQHVTFLASPTPCPLLSREFPGPPGFLMAHLSSSFRGVPQIYIQVDGSWKENSQLAGIAWVVERIITKGREG